MPQSVAVLVFERDREKGEKIVSALEERYRPTLILFKKEGLAEVLQSFDLAVAIMAVGIVVRSLCDLLKNKWEDCPVVAVDSSLRCAVPVVGGHHGGNDLAMLLGERLGLFPAITTATSSSGRPCLEDVAGRLRAEIINKESSKAINLAFLRQDVSVLRLKGPRIVIIDEDVAVLKARDRGLVVGVGARRGVLAAEVLQAIDSALEEAGRRREEIGWLATATLKRDETGISEAARILDREVLYLSKDVLNAQSPLTPSQAGRLGLSGVAEPAVLALASRIILPKKAYGRVTVALGE